MSPATHVVSVSAGAGPIEARRFVRQLGARIEAICESAGLLVLEIVEHESEGEPRSVDLHVAGDAPGALAAELGTHALVARSDRRGHAARKRWFARVTVQEAAPSVSSDVDVRDLEITATTAGGPGGQHVNKVASAVRVRHLPSGLSVRVADERSQRANLRRAVERIGALLAARSDARSLAARDSLRAEKYRLERGRAVRTYRLGHRGALELAG